MGSLGFRHVSRLSWNGKIRIASAMIMYSGKVRGEVDVSFAKNPNEIG
jgi:hypothetical protein